MPYEYDDQPRIGYPAPSARHRDDGQPRPRTPRPGASRWHWLLLVAIIVPLLTPLYNRMDPRLFGIPFFYWCQLAFVGLSTVTVATVHILTRNRT